MDILYTINVEVIDGDGKTDSLTKNFDIEIEAEKTWDKIKSILRD